VFIFLFQSFPLGDKSSVNLRGEYHTENVTTFDDITPNLRKTETSMEVDVSERKDATEEVKPAEDSERTKREASSVAHTSQDNSQTPTVEITAPKSDTGTPPLDTDAFYPIFWRLQESFSAPTRLFVQENFDSFQKGVEATLETFKKVNNRFDTRASLKASDESKKGTKRTWEGDSKEAGSNFNPKYLTSRDLFELEVCHPLTLEFNSQFLIVQRLMISHSGDTYLCKPSSF
jgi:THO complex subunit 1